MTKISYFGKPNSTLGSVVPLEIFVATDIITRFIFILKIAIYMFQTKGGGAGGGVRVKTAILVREGLP